MKLKIKVTKEILRRSMMCGTVNVGNHCAIALACNEIFPDCWVSMENIWSTRLGQRFKIELPSEATFFIYEFDSLKSTHELRVELPELEFEVTLGEDVLNSINIEEAVKAIKESKTLELV